MTLSGRCNVSIADEIRPAAGAEVMTNGVRVRVFFPFEAWVRFQAMSDRLALEEKTLVRVLASLQLAQLEAQQDAAAGGSARMRQVAEADLDERAATLMPDFQGTK